MSLAIVDALFSADAGTLSAWRPILDAKVHVRVGNRRPAVGIAEALSELEALLAGVGSFGGRYREVWTLHEATLVETEIVCRAGFARPEAAIPCALIFRTGGGPLALDVRFYLDPAPLFAAGERTGRRRNGH